jgi:hypothetical protein
MADWMNTDFGGRKVLSDQQPEKKERKSIKITVNKSIFGVNLIVK